MKKLFIEHLRWLHPKRVFNHFVDTRHYKVKDGSISIRFLELMFIWMVIVYMNGNWSLSEFYLFLNFCLELTLSWQRSLLYRNQFSDLLCKSIDWFLYYRDLRHERVIEYWLYFLQNRVINWFCQSRELCCKVITTRFRVCLHAIFGFIFTKNAGRWTQNSPIEYPYNITWYFEMKTGKP